LLSPFAVVVDVDVVVVVVAIAVAVEEKVKRDVRCRGSLFCDATVAYSATL
jgi:hypothetical protein